MTFIVKKKKKKAKDRVGDEQGSLLISYCSAYAKHIVATDEGFSRL